MDRTVAFAVALAGCIALPASPAAAGDEPLRPARAVGEAAAGTAERLHFDIPSQPLPDALQAYGVATGVSGLYSAEAVAGQRSGAVRGWHTPDAALHLLLEGTGLGVHYTAADAFVLEPTVAGAAAVPVRDMGLDSLLQQRVRDAFCRDPRLAPGRHRIAVTFRLGAQGRVEAPLLLGTTGDALRDGAVLDALRQVDVGRAPGDRSQPFVMLILPRPPGAAPECTTR